MSSADNPATPISIVSLADEEDARACARLMCSSEPWITLGRSYETSLAVVADPTREVYLTRDRSGLAGFLVLCMTGAFVGYIQTVCVDPRCRGRGLGSTLLQFAEQRIRRTSPNIFMCVSSFNEGARRLYQRHGYEVVGELTDYIVEGHSEILLRKTFGSITSFVSER
jgi:[ribosomal protein S18]-alanine N-acetyltransferase